jgi:hypothetical protein
MLKPGNRTLLLESLRPPPGFELDSCLGTTYSLDLQALLTAPLAFTLFEREDEQGSPNRDPLALLESLRRYAGRMHIFCQSGRIQVPKSQDLLFSYLEDSVIQVAPASDGVFHPKIWILRYLDASDNILYRLLCLSRNLTFDRSWDTILCLEGWEITNANQQENLPLAAFLEDLPHLAFHSLSEAAQESVALFSRELANVRFELPEGFDSLAFHPMGTPQADQFSFPRTNERMLIISPFLAEKTAADLAGKYPHSLLVTRMETAQDMPAQTLRSYEKVFVLPVEASPAGQDQEEDQPHALGLLTGLHAKLYVADQGGRARLWTGSANATEAAFRSNVEFMVELGGQREKVGIEAILGRESEKDALWGMLQEYAPSDDAAKSVDDVQPRLEEEVDSAISLLGRTVFQAWVHELESETCRLSLAPDEAVQGIPDDLDIQCWPITVPESHKQAAAEAPLSFDFLVTRQAMTAFFAFGVSKARDDRRAQSHCVIKAELSGAPSDRFESLLRSLLHNRTQVLRLLLLLLEDRDGLGMTGRVLKDAQSKSQTAGSPGVPLLESMLRSLHRNPGRLDRVDRLVRDLCRTVEGRELLPEGFLSLWESLSRIRQEALQ